MTFKFLASTTIALALAVVIAGCNSSQTDSSAPESAETDHDDGEHAHDENGDHDHSDHEHGEHDHSHHDHGGGDDNDGLTDMEKMTKTLASFSAEDRESAMKQHFCPISKEMLGVSGVPFKVAVKDQEVWVCCDDCEEKLLADPDKYVDALAK